MNRFYHVILEQVTQLGEKRAFPYRAPPSHNAFQDTQINMSTPCFMPLFPPPRQYKINTGCAVTPIAQNLITCHSKTKRQNDFHLSHNAPKHCHMFFCWYSSKPLKMLYSHVADKKSNW